MTASCQGVEPLLQAYLDRELDAGEQALVEGHLEGCGGCLETKEELERLGGELRALFAARAQEPIEVTVSAGAAESLPVGGEPAAEGSSDPVRAAVDKWAAPKKPRADFVGGYRVEHELGRGGMGVVYRAVQLSMDRPVALKVLAPQLSQNPKYLARFLREARLAATVSHPNLVAIYDVGQDGDRLYYSMELVEGEDLEGVLARDGALPQRRAAEIALELAKALEAAAAHKIVHRDVKPANVLLTRDGGIKLADLGLAKDTEDSDGSLTRSKTVIGSPNYMSPEQAEDLRRADHRSDVYMLGATLLHAVSGEVPFGSGSPVEVIARVLRDPPPIPDVVRGEAIDPALRAILRRCLEKSPADRFQTAAALREALERFLRGGARAAGSSRRVARRSGRARRRLSSEGPVAGLGRLGSSEGRIPRRAPRGAAPLAAAAAVLVSLALFGAYVVGRSGGGRLETAAEAPRAPAPSGGEGRPVLVSERQAAGEGGEDGRPSEDGASEPSAAQDPRAPSVRDEPAPRGDPAARLRLAELQRRLVEEPEALGELHAEASALAAAYPEDPAGKRARRVAARTAARLRELLAEVEERAAALQDEDRLWEAQRLYASFVQDHGAQAPGSAEALLAAKTLEARIRTRVAADADRFSKLVARGEGAAAEELLSRVATYAGEDVAARLRSQAGAEALARAGTPAPPEESGSGDGRADEGKVSLAGRRDQGEGDSLAAAAKAQEEALAMLDRAREALDQGELGRAGRLIERATERAGAEASAAFRERAQSLREALHAKREGPPLAEVVAAFFRGRAELLDDGRVRVEYDFRDEAQAEDWRRAPQADNPRERALREWLSRRIPAQKAPPWSVVRGYLVGYGFERAQHVATFDAAAPVEVELDARGQQNLMVGFGSGDGATLAGLGFVYPALPIAQLVAWNKRNRAGLKDLLERMERTISQSRQRGPCLAVFREAGLFRHRRGEKMVRLRLKKRTKFVVVRRPSAEEGHVEIELRAGRKLRDVTVLEGKAKGPLAVGLAALGAPGVGYKRIALTARLHPRFVERLRELARKTERLEGLRAAYEEAERAREEEERKRREREGEDERDR
ncbi:MAG: hypothetical protein D6731_03400 [Planctomycetota bacterium]|nr:MAG: hypothetical protein D6731_03400 [Planctomycetota bacterium]